MHRGKYPKLATYRLVGQRFRLDEHYQLHNCVRAGLPHDTKALVLIVL